MAFFDATHHERLAEVFEAVAAIPATVPLGTALRDAAAARGHFVDVFASIADEMDADRPLVQAAMRFPVVFDPLVIELLLSGPHLESRAGWLLDVVGHLRTRAELLRSAFGHDEALCALLDIALLVGRGFPVSGAIETAAEAVADPARRSVLRALARDASMPLRNPFTAMRCCPAFDQPDVLAAITLGANVCALDVLLRAAVELRVRGACEPSSEVNGLVEQVASALRSAGRLLDERERGLLGAAGVEDLQRILRNARQGQRIDVDETCPDVSLMNVGEVRASAWLELSPIVVGPSRPRAAPRCHVCFVAPAGHGRIEVYADADAHCFREDAIAVGATIFVGAGERVVVVDTSTLEVHEHRLDCYFGYLHALPDGALVATGCSLWRVDRDGAVRWRCENLGIDGVVISDVLDGVVYGDAELNPPGGWVPLRVDVETGRQLD